MERRTFLRGLVGLIAAPAIIRTPGLIMPVKAMPVVVPTVWSTWLTAQVGDTLVVNGVHYVITRIHPDDTMSIAR